MFPRAGSARFLAAPSTANVRSRGSGKTANRSEDMRGLLNAIKRVIGAEPVSSAKRVLFAWEMGAGLGHINRLLPLARALSENGCDVIFALRVVEHAHLIRKDLPHVRILQAPERQRVASGQPLPPAHTYADLLHRTGYAHPEELGRLVRTWIRMFEHLKPDLVVCDHSPTVVLAGSGVVPVIHLGSGFATPPTRHRFLVLNERAARGAKERQAEVLASIRAVQTSLGREPLENLTDLFASAAHHFACCLPELDPYRSARREPAIGTLAPLPLPTELPTEPFVFGYLAGDDARTASVVEGLIAANVAAGFYVRDGDVDGLKRLVSGTVVTLYDEPQRMPDAILRSTAVVHHAGLSTTEQALAAGRPQFLLPRYIEQELTAEAVARLGCGVNLGVHRGDRGAVIARALKSGAYQAKARFVAERVAERCASDVKEAIVSRCMDLLKGGRPAGELTHSAKTALGG